MCAHSLLGLPSWTCLSWSAVDVALLSVLEAFSLPGHVLSAGRQAVPLLWLHLLNLSRVLTLAFFPSDCQQSYWGVVSWEVREGKNIWNEDHSFSVCCMWEGGVESLCNWVSQKLDVG